MYVCCDTQANSALLAAPSIMQHKRTPLLLALTHRKGSSYLDIQLKSVASSRHKSFYTGYAVKLDCIPASSYTSFLKGVKAKLSKAGKAKYVHLMSGDIEGSLTVAFCPCWSQPNPDSTNNTCSRWLVISEGGVLEFRLQAICLFLLAKVGTACVPFRQTPGWCR